MWGSLSSPTPGLHSIVQVKVRCCPRPHPGRHARSTSPRSLALILRRFYGLAPGQLFRDIGRFYGSASSELETAAVNPWLRFLARKRSFNHTNLWASSSPSLMTHSHTRVFHQCYGRPLEPGFPRHRQILAVRRSLHPEAPFTTAHHVLCVKVHLQGQYNIICHTCQVPSLLWSIQRSAARRQVPDALRGRALYHYPPSLSNRGRACARTLRRDGVRVTACSLLYFRQFKIA